MKGMQHGARTGTVRKAWETQKIDERWKETTWAKKLQAKKLVCHSPLASIPHPS